MSSISTCTATGQSTAADEYELVDLSPPTDDLVEQVLAGLEASPKTLPSKFFYDERGSQLFEQICELDEYYPTRTELGIMRDHGDEMARRIGSNALVIELGSGAGTKSRLLLETLESPAGYVPIDICAEPVLRSAAELRQALPHIPVMPVCADYHQQFDPPRPDHRPTGQQVVYFPGSTLGNLGPDQAQALLNRMAQLCGPDGAVLIGLDLVKSPQRMIAAYNDSQGVTAAFNFNLLDRLNREAQADFDLDRFAHRPIWNAALSRMESRLVSLADQHVHVAGQSFSLSQDEPIRTETSYKYTLNSFAKLAQNFDLDRVWTDPRGDFAVLLITPG